MQITDLFKRRGKQTLPGEPASSQLGDSKVRGPLACLEADRATLAASGYTEVQHRVGSNAVFSVIDTLGWAESQSRHALDRTAFRSGDLIDGLYAQYCQALDDPQALMAGDWVAQDLSPGNHGGEVDFLLSALSADSYRPELKAGSIDALVGGSPLLEDEFGPLGGGEATELIATEPVSEILRLFAPAEYQLAVARRSSAILPMLARREHHTLSIDSAMPTATARP